MTPTSYATEQGWPVLTFDDDDFLGLVESDRFESDHAGVVFASQHARGVGELVRRVDDALQRNDERELTNRVVYA